MTGPCFVKAIFGELQNWENYNQKLKTLKITKTYECPTLVFHLNQLWCVCGVVCGFWCVVCCLFWFKKWLVLDYSIFVH